ncbi:hypothetical protein [Actinophytocola sp.]|uniref:hypothetical protein n=1 Tax=Actinophytocola sp. TaxID=1872138 RepID=UPI002EDAF6B1
MPAATSRTGSTRRGRLPGQGAPRWREWVGTPERTEAPWAAPAGWPRLGMITGGWFLAGPLWTTCSPRARAGDQADQRETV